jgi:hypothetical protein
MPSNIKRTAKGYWHDLDPFTRHKTKSDAQKDRTRLLGIRKTDPKLKRRAARVSTFYTILQDKRKNNPTKFTSVPQGPHTFPHFALHDAISEARQQGKLDDFHPLIPSPADYNKIVTSEIPSGHAKEPRAKLAQSIYARRHATYLALQAKGVGRIESETIRYADKINKLIQMHPHGSYAYKSTGASRKALKGKGESSTKPVDKQIDLPAKHGFKDITPVNTRNNTLVTTVKKFGVK